MATSSPSIPCQINTAAGNASWVQAISQALTAIGLPIDSAVTGQINYSSGSIALPTFTAGTQLKQLGFETRILSGGSLPTIYINVYYGLWRYGSSDTNYWPVILMTFGGSVSTAGVLSAPTTEVSSTFSVNGMVTPGPTFSPPNVSTTWNLASDGVGSISWVIDPTNARGASNAGAWSAAYMERARSYTTGSYDSTGYFFGSNGSGSAQAVTWTWNGGTSLGQSVNAANQALVYGSGTSQTNAVASGFGGTCDPLFSSSSSGSPSLFPLARSQGALGLKAPQLNVLLGYTADNAAGSLVTATMFGATQTYMASGLAVGDPSGGARGPLYLFQ
jgi:hypothetical protein